MADLVAENTAQRGTRPGAASTAEARIAVFVGPSLTPDRAALLLPSATLLPPVRLGDMCAAVLDGFGIIVIIDGFFEQVPTVWHKEILWALSQGCSVYGASSMGALRAAELAPFGMRGVGTIFQRFLDGTYNDDDEVTIIHAVDEEFGYRSLSVAMASIRDGMERAVRAGVCTEEEAALLIARSKARHYSERCWPLVMRDAAEAGLDDARAARLAELVREPGTDAKTRDAEAVLVRVREDLAAGARPPAVPFEFESTYNFEKLMTIVRAERAERRVVQRLGAPSERIRARADHHLPLLQLLVEREARRLGLRAAEHPDAAHAVAWAESVGIDPQEVREVLRLESLLAQLEQHHHSELAMFTESAQVAARLAGSPGSAGRTVSARLQSQESNRLDDGRVVR